MKFLYQILNIINYIKNSFLIFVKIKIHFLFFIKFKCLFIFPYENITTKYN